MLCKHLESGRRALVKEFYANLEERRNLKFYVRGGGFLLEKGPSPNYSNFKKEDTTPSMSNSKRTLISKKLQRSSQEAKGNGREQGQSPMHSSIEGI